MPLKPHLGRVASFTPELFTGKAQMGEEAS